jgi:hypothetical protein
MSMMFWSPVTIKLSSGTSRRWLRARSAPDLDGIDPLDAGRLPRLDRVGPVPVQARLGRRAIPLAERQLDALLVRLDPVEAGCEPNHHGDRQDDEPAPAAAHAAAGQEPLEALLTATDEFLEIGRARAAAASAAGAPGAAATATAATTATTTAGAAAPRATATAAFIFPGHLCRSR